MAVLPDVRVEVEKAMRFLKRQESMPSVNVIPTSNQRRDVTRYSDSYQLARLVRTRDEIGREMIRCLEKRDMIRVHKKALKLAEVEGKIGIIHRRMVLNRDQIEGAG